MASQRVGEWNVPAGTSGKLPTAEVISESMGVSLEAYGDLKTLATSVLRSSSAKDRTLWRHVRLDEKRLCYDEIQSRGMKAEHLKEQSDFEQICRCLNDENILDHLAHRGWTNVRNAEGKKKRRKDLQKECQKEDQIKIEDE